MEIHAKNLNVADYLPRCPRPVLRARIEALQAY